MKLKLCPCCGKNVKIKKRQTPSLIWRIGDYTYYIRCRCGLYIERKRRGWLVKAWNRRVK